MLDTASNSSFERFVEFVAALWPLWVLLAVVGLGKLSYRAYRLRRLAKSGIRDIDAMDGRTFEEFLSTLFGRLGYHVEDTRYRGDYGADLVIAKDGVRTAVQAKRWTKRVGIKAVQEAVASKGYYDCDRALVVSNREFTPQAQVLARANNVDLWGRSALVSKLLAVRGEPSLSRTPPTSAVAMNGGAHPGQCVTCGVGVSDKVRDYCIARPQRFGGRIYCFTHQRGVRAPVAPESP